MKRVDGRENLELRDIKITPNFLNNPIGSVLIEMGGTRVICSATIVDEVPKWIRDQNIQKGWITAEYQLLPTSTINRVPRERKGINGRTYEIQRLIGRSLRASCELYKLYGKTIYIDCDVIDADGGTRTASITGGMLALKMAIERALERGILKENPLTRYVAAISVGIVDGEILLDLCYDEDSKAEIDMNFVMGDDGSFIEIQGTGEERPFTKEEMFKMMDIATEGISKILSKMKEIE